MTERTLLLQIYDPLMHTQAVANKVGLRTAFEAIGPTHDWDYLANDRTTASDGLINRINYFQPTLIFSQLGSTDYFSPEQIAQARRNYPAIRWANWNGDYWPEPMFRPDMLALLRHLDIQLAVNGAVIKDFEQHGIRAAYFPFGFEPPNRDLPDVPRYDVVYLGNNYSESRRRLYDVLRALPYHVGIYGSGWPQSEGECTYDFTMGEALYRNAKLTISDAQWPDADGYLSNRPFQAMAAGCFLLQQRVRMMDTMTGLREGKHYVGYDTMDELPALVAHWLAPEQDAKRREIAWRAQKFVRLFHGWDARVTCLVEKLLPALEEVRT